MRWFLEALLCPSCLLSIAGMLAAFLVIPWERFPLWGRMVYGVTMVCWFLATVLCVRYLLARW